MKIKLLLLKKRMSDIYSLLMSQLSNSGSKTNVVRPFVYLICFLFIPTFFFFQYKMEVIGYIILGFIGLLVICFLVTYFYCLFKNPDLLRSEKYNLEKTAIEKTATIGDSRNIGRVIPSNTDYVIYEESKKIEE